ncbi:hypothetical protein H4217_006301 [Coemansia sp. RSA 1939]|nr:hypothetical protein H4217_006301 [Coemansia sp. RSA 1939]KAJ2607041.1 hypothetical protein EV177_005756 [Coemansia sp. RSA 1804]
MSFSGTSPQKNGNSSACGLANGSKPLTMLYVCVQPETGLFEALIEHTKKVTGAYPVRVRREAAGVNENQWSVKCKGGLQYNELKRNPLMWHGDAYFWHTDNHTIVYSLLVWPVSDEFEELVVPELNKTGNVIGMPEKVTRKSVDVGHIYCAVEIHESKQVPKTLVNGQKKIADVYVNSNEVICGKCLMVCAGPNCCRTKDNSSHDI